MQTLRRITLFLVIVLSGCAKMQRLAHVYTGQAPAPNTYRYQDGGTGLYYSFTLNDSPTPDTFIFFYGGSGCSSWKYVMPDYVNGISVPTRFFVLNKRFVSDKSSGMFSCSDSFKLADNPEQWLADYSEFISAQLYAAKIRPKNVVLVGISEGALVAARVAGQLPDITHLAIIGDGGFSMRDSLIMLKRKGALSCDVAAGWEMISSDPQSIEKSWCGNSYRYWSDVMDNDPLPVFLRLKIPILLGIGEQDMSVPVESALFLKAKFEAEGKSNLTLMVYPGADHRLNGNGVSYRQEFFSELSHLLAPSSNISIKKNIPYTACYAP